MDAPQMDALQRKCQREQKHQRIQNMQTTNTSHPQEEADSCLTNRDRKIRKCER